MGEAQDGDGRPGDTRRTEQVRQQQPGTSADVPVTLRKAPATGREGKLGLNVPQVAGSAVAAVVAAKLASNLGIYGTILGAGVVSVLGTCGGTILQHVFRRTGQQVQVVAVQARPVVRRTATQAWSRTDVDTRATGTTTTTTGAAADRTRTLPAADSTPTRPVTSTDPAGKDPTPPPLADATGTTPPAGTPSPLLPDATRTTHPSAPLTGAHPATPVTPGDGYGEATSYRGGRRGWKRPLIAVGLAFGLTMAGITGYEAIAGENISGHGHGTTIGNAVTGHNSSHSGGDTRHSPTPTDTPTPPSDTPTGPQGGGHGRPTPHTTPSAPDSPGTGGGNGTSGGGHSTPPPTNSPSSPPPTSASPSPTDTPGGGTDGNSGNGVTGGTGDGGFQR
ncbi:hypothetical protein [Streptomyces sp. NBC_01198]|uniref:hypothetical protein n=1 Tax=Streptomyces sp. NBC_01198 TaxID=2903769 RepID=UPI002E11E032|nr:hypothetical protein OG702_20090 [Streptomyces sp. NBC_01198]